jgi:hypothetical protein
LIALVLKVALAKKTVKYTAFGVMARPKTQLVAKSDGKLHRADRKGRPYGTLYTG